MEVKIVKPTSAINRFKCPTCGAKRGRRCQGGRVHKMRRNKG